MSRVQRSLAAAWIAGAPVGAASAQLTVFPSRAAFNASHPNAAFENFEEARVDPGSAAAMVPPLDSTTNNAIFHPGEIVAGLRLTVGTAPLVPSNLVVAGPGFGAYVSRAVSYNSPSTTLPQVTVLFLNGNVKAFALDAASNPSGNDVSIRVYSGATLLGTYPLLGVAGSGVFFGAASSSASITHVTLSSGQDYIGVDNIAFAAGTGCYPDCNSSGTLTVADFGCFQTKFVAGDPYADCNGDGSRTVADFGCFQTKFVQGCP